MNHKAQIISFLLAAVLSPSVIALPDDKNQEIIILSNSQVHKLDEGLSIYYGSAEQPAELTQGSLKISGLEIIIEEIDGVFHKVTALGQPAHFQQKPEADQSIVEANGQSVIFNQTLQFLSIDGDAEFIQAGDTTTSSHIDYDMLTKTANANSSGEQEQVKIVITPKPD